MRGYVEKGLAIDGHKENIDLIATIIRQEIKSQLDVQVDRLAKMNMKIGRALLSCYEAAAETNTALHGPKA